MFRYLLLSTILFHSINLSAQGNEQAKDKQNLQLALKSIGYYWERQMTDTAENSTAYQSLERENSIFMNRLVDYLNKYPSSINENFDGLYDSTFKCATSSDGKFRIYSWNTLTGGSTAKYNAVVEYITTKGTKAKILYDVSKIARNVGIERTGWMYDTIFSVTNAKTTYYLATLFTSYSTVGRTAGIQAFSIDGTQLHSNLNIFTTTEGNENLIVWDYNMQVNKETNHEIKVQPTMDNKANILYIPVIGENDRMYFKGNYDKYSFNGDYFIKQESQP